VHALTIWRCYCEGATRPLKLVSDHEPLKYLRTKSQLNPRQVRWSQFIERFNYIWEFRAGRLNAADPMSRAPHAPLGGTGVGSITGHAVAEDAVQAHLAAVTRTKRGKGKHANDQSLAGTESLTPQPSDSNATPEQITSEISWLEAVKLGYADENMQLIAEQHALSDSHGLYYREDGTLYIPTAQLQQKCLQEMHDAPYSGHKGIKKTTDAVARLYWWPTMRQDVKRYVSTCLQCQRNKASTQKPGGLLQPLPVPQDRWDEVTLDYITGLPCTDKGHDAILVFCDRLTKMVKFAPCKKTDGAAHAARLFKDYVFANYGMPSALYSDRDSRFTSQFWKELLKQLGVKQKMSSAFHPQTDGQTERANRVLEEYLRHYVNPRQDDWDGWLPLAEFAYNNSVHEATGHTPFFMNYARHPQLPGAPKKPNTRYPAVQQFVQNVAGVVREAKDKLEAVRHKSKRYADEKRRDLSFKVGDLVLLSTKNIQLKTPGVNKLLPKYLGPFKVTEVINPVAYRLELPACMKCHNVFHTSLLLKYRSNGSIQPPPLPLEFDDGEGGEWFSIELILDRREVKKGRGRTATQYLVKWAGYGDEHNMWCDEDGVTEPAVQEYLQRTGLRPAVTPSPPAPTATARSRRATADYSRGRHAKRGRKR